MQSANPPRLGLLLLAGLSFAWGINWPVMKIALQEIPPWTFRSWSCLAAGLSLLALARASGGALRPAAGEWGRIATASIFNVSLWHVLIAYGTMMMASGHASVLAFTMPLWAALLGMLVFGDRPSLRVVAALALGIGGIVVLLSRDLAAVGDSPLGAGLVLAGALGWAFGTLYQKRQQWNVGTLALAGWQLLIGSIPIFVVLPFVEGVRFPEASLLAWACMAYLTFVALVFAYFAWFKIVSLFPANVAAIGTLLTPVIGVASGAVILGEPFGWREIVALILVGSALTLVLIIPAMQLRAASAPAD